MEKTADATPVGVLSVFDLLLERLARPMVGFSLRLKRVLGWWRVDPALYLLFRTGGVRVEGGFAWLCRLRVCLRWWAAASMALLLSLLSLLTAAIVVVLRLCGSSERGAQASGWLSGIAGANGLALWLTILPCAGSRGRFGDDSIPMSMSFGAEAEGAARAPKLRTAQSRAPVTTPTPTQKFYLAPRTRPLYVHGKSGAVTQFLQARTLVKHQHGGHSPTSVGPRGGAAPLSRSDKSRGKSAAA
eukprot:scaffold1690_cov118-Isochrysis_galbana.AAC.6